MTKTNGSQHKKVTIAIAAVVVPGDRVGMMRKAQWLKMYDREEDRFYSTRPFLLVVEDEKLAETLTERINEMVEKYRDEGVAYIGELSFESGGEKNT